MATIKEVKASDFQYLSSIEPAATRTSVKSAFKYIVSLSNLTSTYIDDWDAETVFKKDDKWITDKAGINKAFFERKNSEPMIKSDIPEHVKAALAAPLKQLYSGNLRDVRDDVRSRESNIDSYQRRLEEAVAGLRDAKNRLRIAEMAQKDTDKSMFEQIDKILKDLPYEVFDVNRNMISFLCTNDTVVVNRRLSEKIHRRYNLGRLIFTIDVSNMSVSVARLDKVNRWVSPNDCHFHYSARICWGGFSDDWAKAVKSLDLFAALSVLTRWKGSLYVNSVLTPTDRFNHHPAFTEYLDGDSFYGMSHDEILKKISDYSYICAPMSTVDEYFKAFAPLRARRWHEEYRFMPGGGGPIVGVEYERKPVGLKAGVSPELHPEPDKEPNAQLLEAARRAAAGDVSLSENAEDLSHGEYLGIYEGIYFYFDSDRGQPVTSIEFYRSDSDWPYDIRESDPHFSEREQEEEKEEEDVF